MVHITEELVRKRAEHNDGEMFSLEELSLHQQNIHKIEHLEQWCRGLRILYLQNNLISRIENVGRLKKLQYLNLALNNIEIIENLEGCESLQKLDLTVNFVGHLNSVVSLKHNINLRELFLVGNPCADFQGYRHYVVDALPQLQFLDGTEIHRSERLRASQQLDQLRALVHRQEQEYVQRREKEKGENGKGRDRDKGEAWKQREREEGAKTENRGKKTSPSFDGRWYMDISSTLGDEEKQLETYTDEEQGELDFWQTPCSFSPESRLEAHRHLEEKRMAKEKDTQKKPPSPPKTLITADGRVLNVNESKLDFCLTEDEENGTIVLDLAVYRHLDTSLIHVDIQPNYVRVLVKGKVFQIVLPAEVKPDSSKAQRSQSTGHLVLTMPRSDGEIQVMKSPVPKRQPEPNSRPGSAHQRLEVDSRALVDLKNIVQCPHNGAGPLETRGTVVQSQPSVTPEFVDDPDVPPLM